MPDDLDKIVEELKTSVEVLITVAHQLALENKNLREQLARKAPIYDA